MNYRKYILRHATLNEWLEYNPVISKGEPVAEISSDGTSIKFKIGNGVSNYSGLPYISSTASSSIGNSGGGSSSNSGSYIKLNSDADINDHNTVLNALGYNETQKLIVGESYSIIATADQTIHRYFYYVENFSYTEDDKISGYQSVKGKWVENTPQYMLYKSFESKDHLKAYLEVSDLVGSEYNLYTVNGTKEGVDDFKDIIIANRIGNKVSMISLYDLFNKYMCIDHLNDLKDVDSKINYILGLTNDDIANNNFEESIRNKLSYKYEDTTISGDNMIKYINNNIGKIIDLMKNMQTTIDTDLSKDIKTNRDNINTVTINVNTSLTDLESTLSTIDKKLDTILNGYWTNGNIS